MANCTVSGKFTNAQGTGLSGVTLRFLVQNPVLDLTETFVISPQEITATTDSSGDWSLSLVQGVSGVLVLDLNQSPTSAVHKYSFSLVIPYTTTASFASCWADSVNFGGQSVTSPITFASIAGTMAITQFPDLASASIWVGDATDRAAAVAVSGDATLSNAGVVAIVANAVTNAKLAQMPAHTIKGNNTGSTADPLDLTVTQVTAELDAFVGDSGSGGTKGLVPAPSSGDAAANKFLHANGSFVVPAGTGVNIGAYDSQVASASGLVASGTSLYAQSASATVPGMVNTSTQTLAGVKTFSSAPVVSSLTASTALVSDAGKAITSSAVTSTELGYVSGVTSAIQTQINGKQASGNYITALTSDVTASGPGSAAATIAANAVTNSKLAQMSNNTVKGNKSGSTANASDLALSDLSETGSSVLTISNGTNSVVSASNLTVKLNLTNTNMYVGNSSNVPVGVAMSGDATLANTGAVTIASNAVTDAKFRQSVGLSVVGRSANSTGNTADVTATSDNQILRRSGTSIGFGSIDLSQSNSVGSSILPVANGGSGAASFTAYSVICAGTTSTGAHQNVSGVGTSGQILTSNGASALPTWQSIGAVGLSITSKTGNYTLGSEDVVTGDSSGGAFTLTLPTAVGVTGRQYRVKKTDTSLTAITVATTSSQTIDGSTTTKLSTQGEALTVVSDGSNWVVLSRDIPSNTTTYTPTITGLGTVSNVAYVYWRKGDRLFVQGFHTNGTVSANLMTWTLPTGLTIASTGGNGNNTSNPGFLVGDWYSSGSTSAHQHGAMVTCTGTSTSLVYSGKQEGNNNSLIPDNGNNQVNSSNSFVVNFNVPISGWSN